MANNELTAHDAVSILRGALVQAECAIKGREHTGFITRALVATEHVAAPAQGGLSDDVIRAMWDQSYSQALKEAPMGVGNADVAFMNQPLVFAKALLASRGQQGGLSDALPELPDPVKFAQWTGGVELAYTADQMRAYGLLCSGQQGGVSDAARLAFLHSTNRDADGFEYGVARVRWNDGEIEFYWTLSDHSDIDALIQAQAGDAAQGGA